MLCINNPEEIFVCCAVCLMLVVLHWINHVVDVYVDGYVFSPTGLDIPAGFDALVPAAPAAPMPDLAAALAELLAANQRCAAPKTASCLFISSRLLTVYQQGLANQLTPKIRHSKPTQDFVLFVMLNIEQIILSL